MREWPDRNADLTQFSASSTEMQRQARPLEKCCFGQKWLGPCPANLFSQWLGATPSNSIKTEADPREYKTGSNVSLLLKAVWDLLRIGP